MPKNVAKERIALTPVLTLLRLYYYYYMHSCHSHDDDMQQRQLATC